MTSCFSFLPQQVPSELKSTLKSKTLVPIMNTRLLNFDPKTPILYRKKGFAGIYIIFLISAIKHRL